MYSISRYSKRPLQRVGHLARIGNLHSYVRPLILSAAHYSKSKGSDGDKKPLKGNKNLIEGKEKVAPKLEMKIIPVSYQNLSYDERNMKLGRELSPHLTIYKIQLTSGMSILLRISGFVLGMGFWAIGLMGLFCNMDINELATKIEEFELTKNFFSFLKFIIILPFAYHMVVGLRHLIFYLNVFLSKKGIYATGYAALAMTLIVAAALAGINLKNEMEDLSKVSNVGQLGAQVQNLENEKSDEYLKKEMKSDIDEP